MTDIIITCSGVGVPRIVWGRDKDKQPVQKTVSTLAQRGQVFSLSDDVAKHLIEMGVAELVDAPAVSVSQESDAAESSNELEDMSLSELKTMALDLGIKFKANVSKKKLIDMINGSDENVLADDMPIFDPRESIL